MLLAVPNLSEGRDAALVAEIAGTDLFVDVHSDIDHNRSVLTYTGAPAELAEVCVRMVERAAERIDLRGHAGAHPRFGAVDVLPFVPHGETEPATALDCAAITATRIADELSIPVYLYGRASPENRQLPELRKSFERRQPDLGPRIPHLTAGAVCIGVRGPLVAFNVNLRGALGHAHAIARAMRGPHVRALGFDLPSRGLVQVSMNLIEPSRVGPLMAFERVAELAAERGIAIAEAEIVGLVPAALLGQCGQLPLRSPARSIEALCG